MLLCGTSNLTIPTEWIILFLCLVIWETIWKGLALWKSGKEQRLLWFICILILNTVGILPIIYLLFFQKKELNNRKISGSKDTSNQITKSKKN